MLQEECKKIFDTKWEQISQSTFPISAQNIAAFDFFDDELRQFFFAEIEFYCENLTHSIVKNSQFSLDIFQSDDAEQIKQILFDWVRLNEEDTQSILKFAVQTNVYYLFNPAKLLTLFVFDNPEELQIDYIIKKLNFITDKQNILEEIKNELIHLQGHKNELTKNDFSDLANDIIFKISQDQNVENFLLPISLFLKFAKINEMSMELIAIFFAERDLNGILSEIKTYATDNSKDALTYDDIYGIINTILGLNSATTIAKMADSKGDAVITEEETPTVEEEVAVAEEETPTVQEEVTVTEEETPTVEEEVAVAEEETPTVEEEVAVAEEEIPTVEEEVAEEETPTVEEEVAVAEEEIPTVEEEVAVAEEEIPTVEEEVAVTEEETPTVEEVAVAEEETPTVEEEVAVAEEETPTVEEVAVAEEEIPTVEEEVAVTEEEIPTNEEEINQDNQNLELTNNEIKNNNGDNYMSKEESTAASMEIHNELVNHIQAMREQGKSPLEIAKEYLKLEERNVAFFKKKIEFL